MKTGHIALNIKAVAGVMGSLITVLGGCLLFPMLIGILHDEPGWWGFAATAAGSLAVGPVIWVRYRPKEELRVREGFAIVALAWLVLSLVGALPFVLAGVLDSYTDAFFETMSGFTTTGATILGGGGNPDIEDVPQAFLFWRSLAHWLGGMGIIVLTLAILPMLGVGGMQLFKAEVPGPTADKLTPLVKQTAQRLWLIYVAFTALEVLLLLPAMSLLDAVNHAFATMATGGFSTKNGSVGQFGSAYVDWVITLFMLFAGINFALHYRMLIGRVRLTLKDTELVTFVLICLGATALVTVATMKDFWGHPVDTLQYDGFLEALRFSAFQAVAIITTTGFGTADYELWPPLAMGLVFLLFFVGGMAGSTGGGVKVVRHVVLFKSLTRELRRLVHPQALIPVRLNGRVVNQDVIQNILSFVVLYAVTIAVGTLIMAVVGLDLMSALSAAMSTVGNIGPAFGTVGPTENYAHIHDVGKWVLALLMMVGRLEIFTVFILFSPDFWRR